MNAAYAAVATPLVKQSPRPKAARLATYREPFVALIRVESRRRQSVQVVPHSEARDSACKCREPELGQRDTSAQRQQQGAQTLHLGFNTT